VPSASRPPPFTLRASYVARHVHALEPRAAFNRGYLPRPRQTPIRYPPRTATAVPNTIGPDPFDVLFDVLDPDLAMVIVLPGDGIVPQQKAPQHHAVHDMHDRNFVRRKHFHPCQSRHGSLHNKETPILKGTMLQADESRVNKVLCLRDTRPCSRDTRRICGIEGPV